MCWFLVRKERRKKEKEKLKLPQHGREKDKQTFSSPMQQASFSFNFGFGGDEAESSSSSCTPMTVVSSTASSSTPIRNPSKRILPVESLSRRRNPTIVTFRNGVELQKNTVTNAQVQQHTALKEVLCHADLKPGVYEGGFKLWECAIDLIDHLIELGISFERLKVLEAGCGHGLPGIYALQRGAEVDMQDYNEEVLSLLTIPNVWSNTEDTSQRSRVRFFSGDWASFSNLLLEEGESKPTLYDVILSSDTLYSESSETQLYDLLKKHLAPSGVAFLASKAYYFGVGGGTRSFEEKVRKENIFSVSVAKRIEDGQSNIREILVLRRL